MVNILNESRAITQRSRHICRSSEILIRQYNECIWHGVQLSSVICVFAVALFLLLFFPPVSFILFIFLFIN